MLSLGERLGGGSKTWRVDEAAAAAAIARDNGVPFFASLSSPEAVADWSALARRSDEHAREARAYSLVASGRYSEGIQALHHLCSSMAGGTPWMLEMQNRAERLAAVAGTNPTAAHDLLAAWEAQSVSALRLANVP